MNFTRQQVYDACKLITPRYDFEPKLIYAVCLQESDKNKDGSFNPDIARLEQGFYRKYTEPMSLATTSEVLLAASFGIMQMMGESLKEVGFFEWFFYSQCSPGMQKILGSPLSQFCIPHAIDAYCVNLIWMIDFGCQWLSQKRNLANGDEKKMLGLWNGDQSGNYYNKVMEKYKTINFE